ncbi:MAG: type II toxin-antitoxin system toxin ribonuclease C26 [Dermatophilaceae bacterium]
MIVADTSGLLALFNRAEPEHERVARVVSRTDRPLVVSPYVVAELGYLVATRVGVHAELRVLNELATGDYHLPAFGAAELLAAHEVVERYWDQEIGLTDASIVILADAYRTRDVLTLDRRHFGVIRPLSGGHFTLRPSR